MKLKDLLSRMKKTESNKGWVDLGKLGEVCDVLDNYYVEDKDNRMTCYDFFTWICTDTHVGYKAYFLDDDLVALSYQSARKAEEIFQWVSREKFTLVREYLLSLSLKEYEEEEIDLLDLEEDIPEGFEIKYASEILPCHKEATHPIHGRVKVIRPDRTNSDNWHDIEIIPIGSEDDKPIVIQLEELRFDPYVEGEIKW